MALDALRHHEVVVLTGTIDARGTEDDDGQSALQRRLLGLQFAPAIAGVGARLVGLGDGRVGLGLVDGTKDAEARQEDDALHGHRQRPDGLEEVARAVAVDTEEVGGVLTLRGPSGMDDIVEAMGTELVHEPRGVLEVQREEMDAGVLEVAERTGRAHRGPGLQPTAQGFFDDKGPDEARGSCD